MLSSTEVKLCSEGEFPLFSLNLILSTSRNDVELIRFFFLEGEFSLLLDLLCIKLKPFALSIGEIVRSGDKVIEKNCLIGDVGESELIERARVSAIKRRACSRNLA